MIWVQKSLLFFHLIGLGLYVGFHAMTYLLNSWIYAARDSGNGAEELALSRMLFRILLIAMLGLILLIATGLGLSIVVGYGFFSTAWLTVKHMAFVAMILNTAPILFIMRLLNRELSAVSDPPVPESVRALVERRKPFGLFNEIMTGIIILSAVFRY